MPKPGDRLHCIAHSVCNRQLLVLQELCVLAVVICCLLRSTVNLTRYRRGHARRAPESRGSHNIYEIGTLRWQVCQSYAPAVFTPRKYPWYTFLLRGRVDPRAIVWSERLSQTKISYTSPGMEPATFRFVEQCLNQLRLTLVPVRYSTASS